MAFTRRFNQVSTPLAHARADNNLLSPVGWEPPALVQTPLPEPHTFIHSCAITVLSHTTDGIEHIFSVFKSFRWLPVPLKLRFSKRLNVPCKVLHGEPGFCPPLQPHLFSLPSVGFSLPGLPLSCRITSWSREAPIRLFSLFSS